MAYSDSEIVWVKLGNCWWPGEVVANEDRLPEGLLDSLKKKPIAVVRFFQEDTFEYVKNPNSIYKYECDKKLEFIRKGLELHRAKNKFMEKFPADVVTAEEKTDGDPKIVENFDFETKPKLNSWGDIFTNSKSPKTKAKRVKPNVKSPPRIQVLPVKTYTKVTKSTFVSPSTSAATSGKYPCNMCSFSTDRLFVIMDHSKTHSTVLKQTPPKVLVPKTSPQMPKESPLSKVPKTLEVPLDDPVTDEELKLDVKEKTPSTKIAIEKISIGKRSTPRDRKTVTSSKKIVTIPKKRKPAFELKNKLLADWSESDTEKDDVDISQPNQEEPIPSTHKETSPIIEKNETAILVEDSPTAVVKETRELVEEVGLVELDANEIKSENVACFDFLEDSTNEVHSLRSTKTENMSERMSKRLRVDDDSLKNQIDSLLNSTEVPLITVSDKEPILVDETTRPKILPPKERNKRFFKSKCKGNGIDDTLENPKDSSLEITVNEPAIDALNSLATVICAENNPSESALLMNIPKKKHLRLLKAEIESQQMPALKVEAPVIITLVEETIIPKMKRKSFDAKDLSEPQEGTPKVFQKKNKLLKISTEDIDSGSRRTTRKSTRNDSGRDKKEDTTVAKELNKNLTIKETVEPSLKKLKMDVRIKTPEEPTAKKIKLDEFAMKTDKLDEPVVKKLKVIETLRILENSEVSKKIEQTVCTETSPIAIAVEASQNEIYSIESQKELPEPTESMLIKASGELNSLNDLCVTPNALKDELSIEINGNVVDEQKPIKISSTDIKDTMESPPTLPETIDIPTEDTSENKPSENVTACEAILEPDVTKIKPIIKTRVQHESNKRKKGLKMSSEKMDEMKRLGFIVDQPHGKKILTATGLKRLRQENILAKSKRKQSGSSSTSGQNEEISETNISSAVVETKEESFSLACENNTSTEIEVIPEQIETKEPEQPVEEVVALEDICAEESIDELKKDELNHSGDSQTVQDSTQILALPADNFGGPINSYYLCTMGEDGMAPINNILYSYMEETKQLVPFEEPPESGSVPDSSDEGIGDETEVTTTDIAILPPQIAPTNIVIDTPDGQNIMLDQQMLLTLVSQGETSQILTSDGQPISQLNDILAAIANNELNVVEDTQEIMIPDIINQNLTFQHQPAQVSETNALLTQRPRMSTTIAPKILNPPKVVDSVSKHLNLEESLKSIGVTTQRSNIPPSLELPITVTNPAINLIDSNHRKISTLETLVTPLIQSTKENET